ncbi:hypothetical protein NXV57_27460 [Bacteroides thetaiotaomicron]|nr:hypothetical protein [Bacteroides thetaiotaomicron]
MKHKGGEVGGVEQICTIFSTLERTPVISSSSIFLSSSCCMAPVLSSPAATSDWRLCLSYSAIISPCSMADCAMNWANSLRTLGGQRGGFVDYFHRAYDGLGDGGVYA